mgnify:CR=1 FL=1
MFIVLVVIILFVLLALGMYLVIVGGNINKSERERMLEDEEQLRYLRNYKKWLKNGKMYII